MAWSEEHADRLRAGSPGGAGPAGHTRAVHRPLSEAFFAVARAPANAAAGTPDIESMLQAIAARAERAWPGLTVTPEDLVRYLAERTPADGDVVSALRGLHADDLVLACGCARGDAGALAAFEQTFMPEVPGYLSRGTPPPDFLEEVKQELRTRLFAPGQGRAGIASYSGRGPLGAWLRVTALRVAIDVDQQRAGPPTAYRFEAQATTAVNDPELGYLRRKYGDVVNRAVEKAMQALTPHEATLVAVFFLQQATYGAIARTYHISRRQARRRITELRDRIVEETRRTLVEEGALGSADLDSVIRLVANDLDTGLVAVLKRRSAPPKPPSGRK